MPNYIIEFQSKVFGFIIKDHMRSPFSKPAKSNFQKNSMMHIGKLV